MSMHSLVSVEDIVTDLVKESPDRTYIDVRSELEFNRGSIPHFINAPILYQSERHVVGTVYKEKGQEAAIQLGHELVDPHRDERVRHWQDAITRSASREGVIMCWRGGLRSKIASEWTAEAGAKVYQLAGGYKALRHHLVAIFERPQPMVILSGLTGSGKTDLLLEFKNSAVDLEGAADHRGSVFGTHWDSVPVPQAVFEHRVALQLQTPVKYRLIEDESRMIGPTAVPEGLYRQMKQSPLVVLDDDRASRVDRIWLQYIVTPLAKGIDLSRLEGHFLNALASLKKPLDKLYPALESEMKKAFAEGADLKSHANWIHAMLEQYYDKRYQHGLDRSARTILFRGNRADCRSFLQNLLD